MPALDGQQYLLRSKPLTALSLFMALQQGLKDVDQSLKQICNAWLTPLPISPSISAVSQSVCMLAACKYSTKIFMLRVVSMG